MDEAKAEEAKEQQAVRKAQGEATQSREAEAGASRQAQQALKETAEAKAKEAKEQQAVRVAQGEATVENAFAYADSKINQTCEIVKRSEAAGAPSVLRVTSPLAVKMRVRVLTMKM